MTARTPLLAACASAEAAIAVGTLTGGPIAHLSLTGNENARVFALPTCQEE